jgi:glycerol-3-phosphate acyltransferase PlsY
MISSKVALLILCSYALGCCTAGYYWTLWRTGKDIRRLGGGNAGARNVGRVLGAPGFMVTFVFDFMKGAVTPLIAAWFHVGPPAVIACMVAAVVGHIWPVQLSFHGGKGVATSLGALCFYSGKIGLAGFCVFIPLLLICRNLTLSGMLAFTLTPLAAYLVGCNRWEMAAVSILSILLLFTHRQYIREEIASRFYRASDRDTFAPPEEGQDHDR